MNKCPFILSFLLITLVVSTKAQHSLEDIPSLKAAYNESLSSVACNVNVNAGADVLICEGDLPVQLNGFYSGDALGFSWSPAVSLSDPFILDPMANAVGTYTLSVQAIDDQNLIDNGDFEQGNIGFTSEYITGNANFGNYLVTDNPQNYFNLLSPCGDHTSGNGNMMVVDGGVIQGQDIWCQTITLNPNTDYYFSLWATMVGNFNSPELFFTVNGTAINNPTAIPLDNCLWTEISQIWNSPSQALKQLISLMVRLTPIGVALALVTSTWTVSEQTKLLLVLITSS